MKRLFTILMVTFLLCIATLDSKSQSYLDQTKITVLINISNYTYNNSIYVGYNPYPGYSMYDAMATVLGTLQSRYDYATNILSTEFQKLKNLQLINNDNIAILEPNRDKITAYCNGAGTKVDYSIYDNFISAYNYITWIYTVPSVKSEISLLGSINNELYRIETKDPDNFYKSDRYKDLGKALNDLKTISRDSISTISWKYGLL